MLDILTPEGVLSFIIYRVSLIRKLSINFVNHDEGYFDYIGLSIRWIRVIKTNKPKKIFFFVFFVKRLL